ncbi:MAG: RagB/SusD family nutrient uptake outer membrane protein, partial [Bacteroidota bacterium]
DGGWGGTRSTSALVEKFPTVGGGGVVVNALVEPNNTYDLLNVPGAYQEWDPGNDATALARKGDGNIFEGYVYFPEVDGFKFADGGWDTNWGDSDGDGVLEPGGDNLMPPSAGFFRIVVNLDDLSYSVTEVQFGLIGSATPGGWDADTDMTYDPESGAWTLTTPLTGGNEIKFRANDDWALNYGDDSADGLLEENGANISVARDGTYEIKLFLDRPDYTFSVEIPASDSRSMFFTEGQTLEITDVSQFTEGYAVTKFKNVTRDGVVGSDLTFPDTDFMLFRLGEAYLIYAEAVVRGGDGGSVEQAVEYINELRQRSYGNEAGNILRSDLDLPFLLDERARELYWEAHRRTDLVRFGQFTDGDYHWPLKGGDPNGTAVPSFRDVYPIPAADIAANPNLTQNPGY